MWNRVVVTIIAVFVLWQVMDYVIHNVILLDLYIQTAELWRPPQDFAMGLMTTTVLAGSITFVLIYAFFFKNKNLKTGLIYGLIYGAGLGFSWGFGTYSVMPIPIALAWGWTLGTLVEGLAAGFVTGLIIKDPRPEQSSAL